jgi:hypothetical protein
MIITQNTLGGYVRREDRLRDMLKYHTQMVDRLKRVDLGRLSEKQLNTLENTLEHLESYALVHVKAKRK